jgi:hypothetical protein
MSVTVTKNTAHTVLGMTVGDGLAVSKLNSMAVLGYRPAGISCTKLCGYAVLAVFAAPTTPQTRRPNLVMS